MKYQFGNLGLFFLCKKKVRLGSNLSLKLKIVPYFIISSLFCRLIQEQISTNLLLFNKLRTSFITVSHSSVELTNNEAEPDKELSDNTLAQLQSDNTLLSTQLIS